MPIEIKVAPPGILSSWFDLAPRLTKLLCFFNERVDAIYVDDELQLVPKTVWSE